MSDTAAVRCSAFARDAAVDPIGTAGSFVGLLLVEWPLPWPRDVSEIAALAGAAAACAANGWRMQGIVPDRGDLVLRAAAYHRPLGPFRRFVGVETTALPAEVAAAAQDLVDGEGTQAAAVSGTEVLVCSHGSRDRCCGSMGTALATRWRGADTAGVRMRRTSHLGGHRFAPTALVLPEGTAWAYLDDDVLDDIVAHRLDPAAAARHYRGCVGLDRSEAQVAERAAFVAHGWTWFGAERWASVTEIAAGRRAVTLGYRLADGTEGAYEAEVEIARTLPVPECGSAPDVWRKTEHEWRLVSFTPIPQPEPLASRSNGGRVG